jgi:hypothetical protein
MDRTRSESHNSLVQADDWEQQVCFKVRLVFESKAMYDQFTGNSLLSYPHVAFLRLRTSNPNMNRFIAVLSGNKHRRPLFRAL